jgi:hypothetical protein
MGFLLIEISDVDLVELSSLTTFQPLYRSNPYSYCVWPMLNPTEVLAQKSSGRPLEDTFPTILCIFSHKEGIQEPLLQTDDPIGEMPTIMNL